MYVGTPFKSAHTAFQSSKLTDALNLKLWKFWFRRWKLFSLIWRKTCNFLFNIWIRSHKSSWLLRWCIFETVLTYCWRISLFEGYIYIYVYILQITFLCRVHLGVVYCVNLFALAQASVMTQSLFFLIRSQLTRIPKFDPS